MSTHGATRNHRLHSEVQQWSAYTETVEDRYCAHCQRWIEVRGVTGALRFMAQHDSADCKKEKKTMQPTKEAPIFVRGLGHVYVDDGAVLTTDGRVVGTIAEGRVTPSKGLGGTEHCRLLDVFLLVEMANRLDADPTAVAALRDHGLVAGAPPLDNDVLVHFGLVRRAYRTNKKGEQKFCGRRTALGKIIADALHDAGPGASTMAILIKRCAS